jgi:membrane protein YqaA with SNARE-associated domain
MMGPLLHAFFEDSRTQILLLLVTLDLALGVIASIAGGSFRLSFVADFARNDLLGKALPFLVIYGGYKYAANADLVIPGLDMEVVMDGVWVVVLAALVGSLFGSLKDLGLLKAAPDAIAGPDPATPAQPTNEGGTDG